MALFKRKSLDELSPAYRRRIERLEAQGYTHSQARGHATTKELSVTLKRLGERPDNTKYLLKKVIELDNPEYTRMYNAMMRAKDPKIRDSIAKELARKIANDSRGGDIYPVHNWTSSKSVTGEDLEEDIDTQDEY